MKVVKICRVQFCIICRYHDSEAVACFLVNFAKFSRTPFFIEHRMIASDDLGFQQTFALVTRFQDVLKTSFVFVFRKCLQDVFKTSHQGEHIRLSHTFSRRFQDVLSRSLQDVFKTPCENVFKTSLRRLAKISSRRFHVLSSS